MYYKDNVFKEKDVVLLNHGNSGSFKIVKNNRDKEKLVIEDSKGKQYTVLYSEVCYRLVSIV